MIEMTPIWIVYVFTMLAALGTIIWCTRNIV
jgi:hypothetical protein